MSNINILIQGPLNSTSLSKIKDYSQYGDIVISHWNHDDIALLNTEDIKSINKVIISNNIPNVNLPVYKGYIISNYAESNKPSTFYYSLHSTYNGLKQCNNAYTIKLRSDEYICNLKPLINTFIEDTSKLVMSNVFTRIDVDYHMGDHFFIAKTDILINAYKILLDFYDRDIIDKNINMIESVDNHAEAILAKALLTSMYKEINIRNYNEKFITIDVNQMKPYYIRWTHANKYWENNYNGSR